MPSIPAGVLIMSRSAFLEAMRSVAVAKLEKQLGVALFDHTKRQIALTAAGEAFLQHAREVIHAAHRAQSSVDDYRDQLTGTITLATAVLPISAAKRFPDLRTITVAPPLTWTLSIASAAPQYVSRAASALADTLISHVDDK
jgi:hypothetical protein